MTLKTFIRKNTWLNNTIAEHGWGNGYVVIPKDHPCYGLHYNTINDHVKVHGGLTFSDYGKNTNWPDVIEPVDFNNEDYIVGFDTCHAGDNPRDWDKKAVQEETESLRKQLEELYDAYSTDLVFDLTIDQKNKLLQACKESVSSSDVRSVLEWLMKNEFSNRDF